MAICPVCEAEIEITSQHHGTLYTCPSCQAVFFVDWSGEPEKSMPVSEDQGPPEPLNLDGDFSLSESTPKLEYDLPTGDELALDDPGPEPLHDNEVPTSGVGPFEDITNFGNSDVSQAAFSYTIIISGIDTAVIYQQVKEALNDSKFGWNILQVMTQIKDGVLTLTSVNAVKASILVQRVKYLPIKLSWSQDVLSSNT